MRCVSRAEDNAMITSVIWCFVPTNDYKGVRVVNRLIKYLLAISTPAFWPALLRGVVPAAEHLSVLQGLALRTVIDVGANKGQFSLVARHLFPKAQIFAFEPLTDELRKYKNVVAGPRDVYPVAVAATKGIADYFVTSRADSSSLLTPSYSQSAAYGVVLSSRSTVQTERLSDIILPEACVSPAFLKIDVQGGELGVLKGAEDLLPHLDIIYCEVSFVQLYEGQPLAQDVIGYLGNNDFYLRGVFNQSSTKQFGATQADLLFFRRGR